MTVTKMRSTASDRRCWVGHDERFAGAQRVGDRLVVADVAVRGLCGGDLLDGQGLDPVEAEHRGDLSQAWTVVHGGSQ